MASVFLSPVSEFTLFPLPYDVALSIAEFLNVPEVCSLGSCSRYLRDLCGSDFLWIGLFKRRWPFVALDDVVAIASEQSPSSRLGWKEIYIKRHNKIGDGISAVAHFVKKCSQNESSLEVGDYLKAVSDLSSTGVGFEDVKLFLFSRETSVLMNLIGLHYSIFCLGIPVNEVNEALHSSQVSSREVFVFLYRLGRWFFGFRLPDERSSRRVSLSELTTSDEEQLRSILNRGAVHEVLRIRIASATTAAVTLQAVPDPRNHHL